MSLNLNQSAAAVLLAQINADLGTSWTEEQVTIGQLMANTGPDAAEYDSIVQVNGVQGVGPNGSFYYKYNRLSLSAIFNTDNSTYSVDGGITYAQLLANINTAMGTAMTLTTLPNNDTNQLYVQGDITPPAAFPFPPSGKSSVSFILTADPNSYIYSGEAILTATTAMTGVSQYGTSGVVTSSGLVYTAPAS
jgi:hypothetical protein